jgi:hypothetical protein
MEAGDMNDMEAGNMNNMEARNTNNMEAMNTNDMEAMDDDNMDGVEAVNVARDETSLCCDEAQLASLSSCCSFPVHVRGETVEADSDSDGDGDGDDGGRRFAISNHVKTFKLQLMKESTKRCSAATLDSRDRVHGEHMPTVQNAMHAFFLKEVPPGVGPDTVIMWTNNLVFNRRNLTRLCLSQWPVETLDRPLCDWHWLNDELVNACICSCRITRKLRSPSQHVLEPDGKGEPSGS